MFEEDAAVFMCCESNFPHLKVQYLSELITSSRAVIPAYTPPEVGALDIRSIQFEQTNGCRFVVHADRQLVSRIARISKNRTIKRDNATDCTALHLLAFCQAMGITIDPSISYYELADTVSATNALDELTWFRAGDHGGQADRWIDFALDLIDEPPFIQQSEGEEIALDVPIHRFRRNYLVMLKAAELLKTPKTKPKKRFDALLDWAADRLVVAPSALFYANIYLSPKGPKKNAYKGIGSNDFAQIKKGVRNAAWDTTFVGHVIEAVNTSTETDRVLVATADHYLQELCRFAFQLSREEQLEKALRNYWGEHDAADIADQFLRMRQCVNKHKDVSTKSMSEAITESEDALLDVLSR